MSTSKEAFIKGLRQMAERPFMYVDRGRLDYLIKFIDGASWGFGSFLHEPTSNDTYVNRYHWEFNYDVQKWLLLRESSSIKSLTLNAWLLMQRCYGVKKLALEQFRIMLEEIDFSSCDEYSLDDTVALHIYQIYRLYKYEFIDDCHGSFNPKVSAAYYPVSDKIKSIIGEIKYSYESIIPNIDRMINESYDDLLVYLHYEKFFMCVKFLYHTGKNGWVEFTNLSSQQDYYRDLIILHAYARLIQKEEHPNHIITIRKINDEIAVDSEEMEKISDEEDKYGIYGNYFSESYSRWLTDQQISLN